MHDNATNSFMEVVMLKASRRCRRPTHTTACSPSEPCGSASLKLTPVERAVMGYNPFLVHRQPLRHLGLPAISGVVHAVVQALTTRTKRRSKLLVHFAHEPDVSAAPIGEHVIGH